MYPVTRRGAAMAGLTQGSTGPVGFHHTCNPTRISAWPQRWVHPQLAPIQFFFQSSLVLSFQEDNVESHGQTGHRHRNVKPRPDYCSFVEDAPHSFLLRQQPGVDTRHLFEVSARADEQQPKHHNPIKRVHRKVSLVSMNTLHNLSPNDIFNVCRCSDAQLWETDVYAPAALCLVLSPPFKVI